MSTSDVDLLKLAIQTSWLNRPSDKAKSYVGKFFETTRLRTKINGKVIGNHGTYRVSLLAENGQITSACSCYIGKHGGCHHCQALAVTFLKNPTTFKEIKTRSLTEVQELKELQEYLARVTLDDLVKELRSQGVTQKAFAEAIGMSSQKLSAIKSSERRNRYFHELGATKLACLWVLERFGKGR